MDDDMRTLLEQMEARLMGRINDGQEKLIERMRSVETNVASLGTAVSALTELARGTNTLLLQIVNTSTDLARRLTDLEKKP